MNIQEQYNKMLQNVALYKFLDYNIVF